MNDFPSFRDWKKLPKLDRLALQRKALCSRILTCDTWRSRLKLQEVVDKLQEVKP